MQEVCAGTRLWSFAGLPVFAVDSEWKRVVLFLSGQLPGWLVCWLALNLCEEAANARESFGLGFFAAANVEQIFLPGTDVERQRDQVNFPCTAL